MIRLTDFSFTYPDLDCKILDNVNLKIPTGAFCLVIGSSGVGKSTFLKSLNGLVPHFTGGNIAGLIDVCGYNPVTESPTKMSKIVGFVFQDPEKQFIFDQVEDELRFNLENTGTPPHEIDAKIEAVFDLLKIQHLRDRQVHSLSGGEKQIVCIASALVNTPKILILDEPTSQLDPEAADKILQVLTMLKEQTSLTILLSEHRIERVLPFTDQVILMQGIEPFIVCGPPQEVLTRLPDPPPAIAAYLQTNLADASFNTDQAVVVPGSNAEIPDVAPCLQIENLRVKIGSKEIIPALDLDLYPGEVHCMMGHNGSGKTTMLRSIMGLQKISAGRILLHGQDIIDWSTYQRGKQIAYLPQDPNALLFAETVTDELRITLENHDQYSGKSTGRITQMLQDLALYHKADAYPRDLSVGERQRAAMGTVTIITQSIILLDEPTRGLDYRAKRHIQQLLLRWADKGSSIFLITHDVEWVYQFANRVTLLDGGRIVDSGPTRNVLMNSNIFQPLEFAI